MLRVTGYADRWSARPGETIRFMVSSQGSKPYTARVARVHCGDPNPRGPGYREVPMPCAIEGVHQGSEQPVHLGSWLEVPALDLGATAGPLAFAATVWPTLARNRQAVLHWCGGGGAALTLGMSPEGGAFARLATAAGEEAVVCAGVPLTERAWHDIACAFDPATGRLRVGQAPRRARIDLDEHARAEAAAPRGASLVGQGAASIAAAAQREAAGAPPSSHFNGKIERPRVLATADLNDALASQRSAAAVAAAVLPAGPRVVAAWDFADGITGDRVADSGPGAWHGRCRNLPTRAMTGSRWTGETQRWTDAPEQWNAIHFHDDDIGDAGWAPSLSLTIPDDWPSGVYALHLEGEGGERDNIPFYVRAARPGEAAKVAFLAPTFTYTVYGQFARPNRQAQIRDRALAWGALPQGADGHPEYGLSTYNWHSDGSGVAYASMLRPMVDKRLNHIQAMDPSEGGSGTYWLSADSYVTDLLDRAGIAYEVLTDHDLNEEGAAALAPYGAVLTGQHPEYHSAQTLDAIAGYIEGGGRFLYLGGNGFYWKVAPHGDGPWALEVRRAEGGIRLWAAEPGEYYHSFDGSYGGLWRRLRRPPQALVGVGFSAQGDYTGHPYRFTPAILDPRVAFLREGIEDAAVPDAEFGERGLMGGGAAGHELDRADTWLGTPRHALVVATAIVREKSYALVNEERYDHTLWPRSHEDVMRSDITFFEAPNGGAVLSVGSMNFIGALPVDGYANPAARLVLNAVRRFADPAPFVAPRAPGPD